MRRGDLLRRRRLFALPLWYLVVWKDGKLHNVPEWQGPERRPDRVLATGALFGTNPGADEPHTGADALSHTGAYSGADA